MLKRDERADPNSCWNRAKEGEMLFVLLERDVATPAAIAEWIKERIRLKKNKRRDRQLLNAGMIRVYIMRSLMKKASDSRKNPVQSKIKR